MNYRKYFPERNFKINFGACSKYDKLKNKINSQPEQPCSIFYVELLLLKALRNKQA